MRRTISCLYAAALVALAAPGFTQDLATPPDVPDGLLELDRSGSPQYETKMYVVQMAGEPGISYEGGIAGFSATAPAAGRRYDAEASSVQQYTRHLIDTHDRKLASIGAAGRKTYSYCHTMNGFAAMLTEREAQQLRGDKTVLNVWEDFAVPLDTNNSPEFLGLNDRRDGLRKRLRLKGEDVIVGIIDSGIVQEHPSFSDTRTGQLPAFCENPPHPFLEHICGELEKILTRVVYDEPPADWEGVCQEGEAFSADDCNNKLIGARWFADGFLAANGSVVEDEFLSPRDSSGHGSHTASTAVGNEVEASIGGTPLAEISGMAPRARLAVYKVCWLAPDAPNESCFFSDSAAATDAAVADGVDVLNFSIGTAAAFNDPQDLAFLEAVEAGVFVARSAGNDGPAPGTTNAGAPWVTSVAASTLDGTAFTLAATIHSPASVAGDYTALEGAITKPLSESGDIIGDVVAADPIDACAPLANSFDNRIALIARGTCTFTVKMENAALAGASAVLMYSDDRPKTVMGGDTTALTQSIPGVMIDNAPGVAILAELEASATVNATLSAGNLISEELEGNIMAGFSSRGPFPTEGDWLKPDISAPGARILAAYTPDTADGSAGGLFNYLSGTSMASPHIAGLGALVLEEHPDWSPAQVKSSLMTTARQDVVKEDGSTPADPFDFGAGHVDPNKAVSPGLTYDAGLIDYLAASCGTDTPLTDEAGCEFIATELGLSTLPADLNLPSIAIGELPGTQTVTRSVTAVDDAKPGDGWFDHWGWSHRTTYRVDVDAPEGFRVEVSPQVLRLREGETASYDVTVTNETAPPGEWRFGSLTWSDHGDDHVVRSPIAVNAAALIAPAEIAGEGANGTTSFDVTFGYTGDYTAGVHGLNNPALTLVPVEDDPNNSFQFQGPGTTIAYLAEVPAGTAVARWATFDEYTSGNDDVDLYLYYCPEFSCTQIDVSANPASNEEVTVLEPLNDPAIQDPYLVFIHGFQTDGGLPADVIQFDWTVGFVDDAGNMTVTAPGMATIGETETLTVDWAGLATGAGAKQLGAISHSDANGVQELTLINITNDPGATICDFGLCP